MSTIALVAASDFNADHFCKLDAQASFDQVYAVDAGFAHLESIGRAPDVALGDFDSLGYVPSAKRVARYPKMKDKSDLELAFDRIVRTSVTDVLVYGALGGRLDHTIANMQLCAHFAETGINVTLIGQDIAIRIVVGPDVFDLPLRESGTVSVFAATDKATGVIERGMLYSLDDETLTNRTTHGLSNELIGQDALVGLESGTLYVFYPL